MRPDRRQRHRAEAQRLGRLLVSYGRERRAAIDEVEKIHPVETARPIDNPPAPLAASYDVLIRDLVERPAAPTPPAPPAETEEQP